MNLSPDLERWRITSGPYASLPGEQYGAFRLPGPCGRSLLIIASAGDESLGVFWEHVSVSAVKYTPNWREMCFVKDLFWDAEETVIQLHVPRSRWISNHATCLHLWKPTKQEIPLPPDFTVGVKELGEISGAEHA
jgi:hypothetical protein